MDALRPVKRGLGGGETNALEDWPDRNAEMPVESLGEKCGLIETALALPRRMQRNGNDGIETALVQSGIIESGNKPTRDKMPEMNLFSVFEIQNHVARDSAAAISGDRSVKVEKAMRAVGAGECGSDRAIERLGAFRAKRRHDPGKFCFAIGAKILPHAN